MYQFSGVGNMYGHNTSARHINWIPWHEKGNEVILKIDFKNRKLIWELNENKNTLPYKLDFGPDENDWVFSFGAIYQYTTFEVEFFVECHVIILFIYFHLFSFIFIYLFIFNYFYLFLIIFIYFY